MSYMLQFCYKIKEETENASFQLRHAWSKTIIDNVKKDILYSVSYINHSKIRNFAAEFKKSNNYVRIKKNKDRIGVCLP